MIGIAAPAGAAEPPNQKDPCSRAGKNSCGTSGVGAYHQYKYGIRWFGDYRGAVNGVEDALFCADLRFWYPGKSYKYSAASAKGFKSRDKRKLSSQELARISYAIWHYGRSQNKVQQGAVMMLVHRLVGDGAKGEIAPSVLGRGGKALYEKIATEATRFAGPYRISLKAQEKVDAGDKATATAQVFTRAGRAVPGIKMTVTATGAKDVSGSITTDSKGKGTITYTPTDIANGASLKVTTEAVAADLPKLYVPGEKAAKRSGQRLMGPNSTTLSATAKTAVTVKPTIGTQINKQSASPGDSIFDSVAVSGLSGKTVTVKAALYGPYSASDKITCEGNPVWSGSFTADHDGTYETQAVTLTRPGYYTYREWIDASPGVAAVQTKCAEVSETTVVRGKPQITTQISSQSTTPGSQISDSVVVSGLGSLSATVKVELWGPYPSKDKINCEGTPAATQTMDVAGDGTYKTEAVTIPSAGYYTYRESINATSAYDGVTTNCGEEAETTISKAQPKVTTIVSNAVVKPGSSIFDNLKVTGLGKSAATVKVDLYGPFASRGAISCNGTPYWSGSVAVNGDGNYKTGSTTLKSAGFYVYRERIEGTETVAGTQGECIVESETSLGRPEIITGGVRVAAGRAVATTSGVKPTSIKIASRRVSSTINPVVIDMASGTLDVPQNIAKVGWWKDGASPASSTGTVLLAGHVDSAKKGAGAFFGLRRARKGDVVSLSSSDGKTRRYKVSSVINRRKADLPTSIFTRNGARRLVMVTCGGPFNTQTGHYRDNIIVTAKPL